MNTMASGRHFFPPTNSSNGALQPATVNGRSGQEGSGSAEDATGASSPKCPFGYDSGTFKLGPLSCLICQALLHESSRCVPCSHVYCRACISRFKDCPLCGADIERIEADKCLQTTVDKFIEGHGRIRRRHLNEVSAVSDASARETLIYEDVSIERCAFLVQQATRAFRAKNIESASSRLSLCEEDLTAQLEDGNKAEIRTQIGVVLGMLGDCCRAAGDAGGAVGYFERSVTVLEEILPGDDGDYVEVMQTLSTSLNKIGDLKYYAGDLESTRYFYLRSLNVRRMAAERWPDIPALAVDVAVSLAKVADVNRSMGNEKEAACAFKEGIGLLEALILPSGDSPLLHQKRESVLHFLREQAG